MKMEGVSDLVNGRSEMAKPSQPSPKEIGREFVRQYYTMLSERPQDVFRFYSHESYFVHDTEQPVQGQQKIQLAIERLAFVDCKARIYTVTGTATMNNGLVIQVCGELSIGENPGRRFLQTFILCPQTPKKYYVHNDVFQWLDRAFGDSMPQLQSGMLPETNAPDSQSAGSVNGEQTSVNGHQQASSTPSSVQAITVDSSSEVQEEEEVKEENEQAPLNSEQELNAEPEANEGTIVEKPPSEEFVEEDHMLSPEQAIESNMATDNTPKTWAKLVGSCTASVPQTAQTSNRSSGAAAQQNPRPAAPPSQPPSASFPPTAVAPNLQPTTEADVFNSTTNNNYQGGHFVGEDGCRLYIGGITRNCNPDSPSAPEKEIRAAFEKYGPVATVNVPRRVLEGTDPQRTIYAFVVMKTIEGARNAFCAARKDRNMHFLHLKLDSFGFEGDATLSEQKGNQNPRGQAFSHRGGMPSQGGGLSRSGYGGRGGGGGRAGGPRGSHGRQYAGSGSEYRHSAGSHPQHG